MEGDDIVSHRMPPYSCQGYMSRVGYP
jgi:hypothetical protein